MKRSLRKQTVRTRPSQSLRPPLSLTVVDHEVLLQLYDYLQRAEQDREDAISEPQKVHKWWLQYLTGLIGVSTLGASITFGVLVTNTKESDRLPGRFSGQTVRTFLAVAYLLFLTTLGLANVVFALLTFHEDDYFSSVDKYRGPIWKRFGFQVNLSLHWLNLLITSCMLAAFVMLALVIVAYSEVAGWMTVGVIGLYSVGVILLWLGKAFNL